jgi:hypothetical protein
VPAAAPRRWRRPRPGPARGRPTPGRGAGPRRPRSRPRARRSPPGAAPPACDRRRRPRRDPRPPRPARARPPAATPRRVRPGPPPRPGWSRRARRRGRRRDARRRFSGAARARSTAGVDGAAPTRGCYRRRPRDQPGPRPGPLRADPPARARRHGRGLPGAASRRRHREAAGGQAHPPRAHRRRPVPRAVHARGPAVDGPDPRQHRAGLRLRPRRRSGVPRDGVGRGPRSRLEPGPGREPSPAAVVRRLRRRRVLPGPGLRPRSQGRERRVARRRAPRRHAAQRPGRVVGRGQADRLRHRRPGRRSPPARWSALRATSRPSKPAARPPIPAPTSTRSAWCCARP